MPKPTAAKAIETRSERFHALEVGDSIGPWPAIGLEYRSTRNSEIGADGFLERDTPVLIFEGGDPDYVETWWASQQAARAIVEETAFQLGDLLTIVRLADGKAQPGKHPPHRYRLVVGTGEDAKAFRWQKKPVTQTQQQRSAEEVAKEAAYGEPKNPEPRPALTTPFSSDDQDLPF